MIGYFILALSCISLWLRLNLSIYILEQEIYQCTIPITFLKGEMLIVIYQFSIFPFCKVAFNKKTKQNAVKK